AGIGRVAPGDRKPRRRVAAIGWTRGTPKWLVCGSHASCGWCQQECNSLDAQTQCDSGLGRATGYPALDGWLSSRAAKNGGYRIWSFGEITHAHAADAIGCRGTMPESTR